MFNFIIGFILGILYNNFFVKNLKQIKTQRKIKNKNNFIEARKGHGKRCFYFFDTEGEERLVSDLKRKLNKNEYYIFNNLILPIDNNGSTQIDHLIISEYGIFVLENKDFSGWIFGRKFDKIWTQITRRTKSTFQNPIRQNHKHVKELQKVLGGVDDKYFNVIAFSEYSEFKTDMPENVMHYTEVFNYIDQHKKKIIFETKLNELVGIIFGICQRVDITNEKHVRYLQNKFNKNALKD